MLKKLLGLMVLVLIAGSLTGQQKVVQKYIKVDASFVRGVDANTGKYMFQEEAVNFIRSVPGPIGVISVAGLYRTGKSYLLNRMLLLTDRPCSQ